MKSVKPIIRDQREYSWTGRVVYITNIPYVYKAQDILAITRQFGRVYRVDLQRGETGKSLGLAFVEFDRADRAKIAVEYLDGAKFGNKNLRAEIAQFPPKELIEIYRITAKEREDIDLGNKIVDSVPYSVESDEYSDSDSGYSSYSSYSYSSYSYSTTSYSSYSYSSYSSYDYSSTSSDDEEEKRKRKRHAKSKNKKKK